MPRRTTKLYNSKQREKNTARTPITLSNDHQIMFYVFLLHFFLFFSSLRVRFSHRCFACWNFFFWNNFLSNSIIIISTVFMCTIDLTTTTSFPLKCFGASVLNVFFLDFWFEFVVCESAHTFQYFFGKLKLVFISLWKMVKKWWKNDWMLYCTRLALFIANCTNSFYWCPPS